MASSAMGFADQLLGWKSGSWPTSFRPISRPIGDQFGWRVLHIKRKWLGCAGLAMRQPRRYPNGQAGLEGLVELLLEPVDRRLRQKVLA